MDIHLHAWFTLRPSMTKRGWQGGTEVVGGRGVIVEFHFAGYLDPRLSHTVNKF
jgi:hypothetical protein